jgi:hypothetical protein
VERRSKLARCILLHGRQHVCVEIQRRADAAVPEPLLHDVGLNARLQQQRRARVREAVYGDPANAGAADQAVPTKNSIRRFKFEQSQSRPELAVAIACLLMAAACRCSAVDARSFADDTLRRMRVDASVCAALGDELRTPLRRATFVAVMEAADLSNGDDSPDWWADRP